MDKHLFTPPNKSHVAHLCGVQEWTILHPDGYIEEIATAKNFGPTVDRRGALIRLRTTNSDCLCGTDDRPHVLVTRFVPKPTPWTSEVVTEQMFD